jgi:coproporphyrinogen III oxidase-like Fe-S oxidoreductase
LLAENLITLIARKKISELLNFEHPKGPIFDPKERTKPILMYIHIPFCEELCPYCSFHRVTLDRTLAKRYFEALRNEIRMYGDMGFKFDGIYVGGGTPTVLIEELIETLRLAKRNFSIKEISVETNPNHLTEENLRLLEEEGVKRLSVGVQSFDDSVLKSIKRYHKYGSGREIKEKLKSLSGMFHTLNIDMIFNFPNQTMESIRNDLKVIEETGVTQVTYYPLMVSAQTRKKIEETLGVVDYRKEKIFYTLILETLSKDFSPSTAWCFSKKEGMIDEYVVTYQQYAGLGSGSIGYIDGVAYANTFNIQRYIQKIERGEIPVEGVRRYKRREMIRYDFLMNLFGLRLDLGELDKRYGVSTKVKLLPEITFFKAIGAIKNDGKKISLTKRGLYYWVIMMREFFTGVNNFRDFLRNV